jgi:hypothetical protein
LASSDVWVFEVLLASFLDIKQFMFKFAMKSNACVAMAKPIDVNLLKHLWRILFDIQIIGFYFLEYFKLAKIAMVQVLDSVEDEQCFSSLAFYKSKLCNRLTTNLRLVVRMFSQKFYNLHNFPYAETFQ